ncbi:dipeptidyl aminopeptidase-like protein 6 [Notothenia coriiceps]|uniref:Dipeptidyl aminopeptidase-like protein 6 n=1 Tax=Notothenia coriiceps TaxID=8208 RepID=A0A6I9PHJ3_9TELE|nr:PREDICTED: dipeptidyl aminopeptidase-like protein 6 [Notothenia coriiceps]
MHDRESIAEVHNLESNDNLRLTLDSMQMPTVEYKEINIDDYTLSMQILKPAGFVETSHYPVLLLVYVLAYFFTYLCEVLV